MDQLNHANEYIHPHQQRQKDHDLAIKKAKKDS